MSKKDREYRPALSNDKDYVAYKKSLADTSAVRQDIKYSAVSQLFARLGLADLMGVASHDYLDSEAINGLLEQGFDIVPAANAEPLLGEVWDYLAEQDETQATEAIFVLGGGNTQGRAKKAAELYKAGLSGLVITTGRGPHYQKDDNLTLTEAEETAAILEKLGIEQKDIVVEKESINTMENVIYARDILSKSGELPESVSLITVPYHMRRGSLTFMAAAGYWRPKVVRQCCDSKYSRENWHKELSSWKVVLLEYVKLAQAQDMGHF
jgi:hypothetical protein